jgi:hypothetical protein
MDSLAAVKTEPTFYREKYRRDQRASTGGFLLASGCRFCAGQKYHMAMVFMALSDGSANTASTGPQKGGRIFIATGLSCKTPLNCRETLK